MSLTTAIGSPARPAGGTTTGATGGVQAAPNGTEFDAALLLAHDQLALDGAQAEDGVASEPPSGTDEPSSDTTTPVSEAVSGSAAPEDFVRSLESLLFRVERAPAEVRPALLQPAEAQPAAAQPAPLASEQKNTAAPPRSSGTPATTTVSEVPSAVARHAPAAPEIAPTTPARELGVVPLAPDPRAALPQARGEATATTDVPPAESGTPKTASAPHGASVSAPTTEPAAVETAGSQRAVPAPPPSPAAASPVAPLTLAPLAASATAPAAAPPAPAHATLTTQIARPLFALATAGNGEHTLTITVTPERLGPVTVHAVVSGERLHIELFTPTEHGRDAVRSVLGELRRDLASTGLHASLGLSAEEGPSKQASPQNHSGQSASQHGRAHEHGQGPPASGREPGGTLPADTEPHHGPALPGQPALDLIA